LARTSEVAVKIGLVGYAGSGKTTVFNTMTGLAVPVGYGGGVRLGTVHVPDKRIEQLSGIFNPKKTTYAEMIFCDVPGERGAERKGLSTRAFATIRQQEALALVLRDFENPTVEGIADPLRDLNGFSDECILADLELVEGLLTRARKDNMSLADRDRLERMRSVLEDGRPLRTLSADELDRDCLKSYQLLTDRPLLVVVNRDEDGAANPLPDDLAARIHELGAVGLALSATVEAEIAVLHTDDQAAFLQDLGLTESALARFIRAAYGLLDLVSFFTIGKDEVRAWTITRGMSARKAAGKIHSDLERGFIRAEVIPYEVFVKHGSEQAVRGVGLAQTEGKEYVVADGDIMNVRFNV
jgi:GTP-binding protein YchF